MTDASTGPLAAPAAAAIAAEPIDARAFADALIDGVPSGVLVIDRDYRIRRVNDFTARWVKRSAAEMVGQRCHALIHAREAPCEDCPCAVAFETGRPASVVHTGLDAQGGTTHAEITALPIRDRAGRVVMALEAVRDVSERERHLRALAASEEALRERSEDLRVLNDLAARSGYGLGLGDLLERLLAGALRLIGPGAAGGIYLLDEARRDLRLSAVRGPAPAARLRQGEGLCGAAFHQAAVLVADGREGAHPPSPGAAATVAIPLVSSARTLGVLWLDAPPGPAIRPERLDLFAVLGRQLGASIENVLLYQGTDAELHRKVAELTAALRAVEEERARAEASERAKEDFVSMVSHDLRSPLTVILADASDRTHPCRDEACQASRASIRHSVHRATAMLDDLVDSVRLESGALAIVRAPLDLAQLVRDAAAFAFPAAQRERLRLELPEGEAPVLGDQGWLERALVNVAGNALKFAPAETPVEVRLSTQGREHHVVIRDHGPGIPPADLPRLFQRFFRASNARRVGGTGLGLYIARLVLEAHGGRAEVRSELGAGVTVTLALPRAPSP